MVPDVNPFQRILLEKMNFYTVRAREFERPPLWFGFVFQI